MAALVGNRAQQGTCVQRFRVAHQWGFHETPPCPRREMGGDSTCLGTCVLLADAECSYASFQDPLSCATLRTVFVLLELFPSYADSQPLLTHRREPSDPEMWDVAPSTEVTHSASILLLQRRQGFAEMLEQLSRAHITQLCGGRCRVLLVPGRVSDSIYQKRSLRSQLYVQSEYLWSCSSRVRAGEVRAEQWHFLLPGTVNITKRNFLLSWYPPHFRSTLA